MDWQQGPGSAWQNHPVGTSYGTNVSSDVKYFTVSGTSLQNSGYYGATTLYKTTITDEDGKPTIEYKDKLGQVIMKRAITNEAGNHDTYYVYNDLGQLCYVLPPLAADASGSADAVNKYGYVYRYDARGNCTYKKLPGCEPITMTYYSDDLLMTSQDGNQLAKNESLYYEYDNLRRLIRTTLVSNTATVVLTENYYDNYNFIGTLATLNFVTENGYDGQHPSAKGLMTGTRVRILDDTNSYLITANYYDYKGQLVQSRSTNHLGGYDFVYNAYDFTGHVIKNQKEHNVAGQTTVTELYDYRYDHAGRLDTTIYTLNDKTPVVLAANTYDELGRLDVKLRHDRVDREEFDYNIRNWATRIKSVTFEEQLFYNTLPYGVAATPCFNGNISYSVFGNTNSMPRRSYAYTYDKLNRLKTANAYYFTYSQSSATGNKETFDYDKMGNVTLLIRYKENYYNDNIDNLIYSYNGNQVTSIYDPAGSRNSYYVKEYQNKSVSYGTPNEMTYDANGNLIKDLDRDIVTIRYNLLNLPDIIQFKNGNQIKNTYNAGGQKLGTEYFTQLTNITPLVDGQVISLSYSSGVVDQSGTAYIGNIEYNTLRGNSSLTAISRIYNAEGYVESPANPQYHYYRRDHLGNNREVWLANTNTTVQRTQYYPSGLPWPSNTGDNPGLQNKKYNGKEFVEMHGYDTYDIVWRQYYPAIARFQTPDPELENDYDLSPYSMCHNNMVKNIDPDGRIVETAWDAFSLVTGAKSFVDNVKKGKVGAAILDGVGVVADGFALVVPGVPGGVGAGIKALRVGDNVLDAVQTGKTTEKVVEGMKEIGPAGDAGGKIMKQLPENMQKNMRTSDNGKGTIYKDPKNPQGNNVRTQNGNPKSPNKSQQKDYVKQTKNGQVVDKNGNKIPGNKPGETPEAHIPKDEFKYKK